MIEYRLGEVVFEFASLSRTGMGLFDSIAIGCGFSRAYTRSFNYERPNFTKDVFSISLVRHPYDWLRSVFFHRVAPTIHNHTMCDILNIKNSTLEFPTFINKITDRPGIVFDAFRKYPALTVLRAEDLPYAFISVCDVQGLSVSLKDKVHLRPSHYTVPPQTEKYLRQQIMKSECQFCERFEYV